MMPLDQRLRMMQLACVGAHGIMALERAGVVQLVEHLLAKEKVTGSSPVARSGPVSEYQEAACRAGFRPLGF